MLIKKMCKQSKIELKNIKPATNSGFKKWRGTGFI